ETVLRSRDAAGLEEKVSELRERARRDMFAEGFDLDECRLEMDARYGGDDGYEVVPLAEIASRPDRRDKPGRLHLKVVKPIRHFTFQPSGDLGEYKPEASRHQSILQPSGQVLEVPVYRFEDLEPGASGHGPALIEDKLFTCRVAEGWNFRVNENRDLFMRYERGSQR
ncbi:MAG TPA: hypothetical protein GX517_01015, partial [Alicyclobacillus sp.]|nr:hypothetical protein [Alicyclobacillus sp.]